jgi:hypothetical protein
LALVAQLSLSGLEVTPSREMKFELVVGFAFELFISFGTQHYASLGAFRRLTDGEAAATLQRSLEVGITHFDTAPFYGR